MPDEDDPELIAWVAATSLESLRARLATGDYLAAQAQTLLSLLLVAIGGALGYAVKLIDDGVSSLAWGMSGATVWLCLVSVVLVAKCIVTRSTEVLHNEPKNLFAPGRKLSLLQIQRHELENVQIRIDRSRVRNAIVARSLDRCRWATIVTPAVFAFTAGAAWLACR